MEPPLEGLDASYALLNDVNARNRDLQAQLRNSLPLLWTDNALVLKSAAPRRRRGGGVAFPAEQSAQSEADQLLLALEGQSSLQVSRRYRRRVEWEVARRIARVDRELQQYPPNQRFWNQKRKETAPPPTSVYSQRGNEVIRSNERNGDGKGVERRQEVAGDRKTGVKQRAARSDLDDKVAVNQQMKTSWMKPGVNPNTIARVAVKYVATSPVRSGMEDEENVQPNLMSTLKVKTSDMRELNRKDVSPSKPLENEFRSVLEEAKVLDEDEKPDDPVGSPESSGASSTTGPIIEHTDSNRDSPPQDHSFLEDDTFKNAKVEKDKEATASQDIDDDESVAGEKSPRRSRAPAGERSSSSIGRQVLSEFRTMPSVASFGAQPILSSGGLGNGDKRLNADVLRRLFSDLDTDKDGHVNRIETCMALHRLQISVSTTKIISFFRNIHSSDGKEVCSRRAQHMPMNEVINYKEFVAFVTAAYDQQQQQKKYRHRAPARREIWKEDRDRPKPSSAPSTSVPIFAHPTNPQRKQMPVFALLPQSTEEAVRLYEMSEVDAEQGETALEDRVMKVIPDFLVSKMLSGPVGMEVKEAAASVVRKSLESLVGKDAVDEKTIREITQELIKAKLHSVGSNSQQDQEDVTGLRKAAEYYNSEQMLYGDDDAVSAMEDSNSEDLTNWVDVLTEEQVGCLVQQIWKDRQASIQHKKVNVEELTEVSEVQTIQWIDEATDTNELPGTVTLSEKGVQVSDQEDPTYRQEDVAVASPIREPEAVEVLPPALIENAEPRWPSQTHFGEALRTSLRHYGHEHDPDGLLSPATSIGILQHLRQQRRLHQRMPHDQNAQSFVHESVKQSQERRGLTHGGMSVGEHVEVFDKESILSSEDESKSASDYRTDQDHQRNHEADDRGLMPLPTTEPVALPPKMLSVDISASHESSLDFVSSVSASTSSSISDYQQMNSLYREIDRHQLHSRSIRRRRPRQRRGRLSVSGSSVPGSMCSVELSEGELGGEQVLDLSDGEIFGDCKRRYISGKSAASRVMENVVDGANLLSSVESGELPAVIKAHASFHQQILAQSTSSSIESGEVEDGAMCS